MSFAASSPDSTSIPIFFLGAPGTGKSALSREIAMLMGPKAVIVRRELTGHLPEDMSGLPFREGKFTQFCPPDFLMRLAKGSGPDGSDPVGALILEDITQAQRAVQVACFQLVQERSMGDIELSPNVRIILTGNRANDKAGARELPSPLRNRVCILELQPDLEEWMYWAGTQGLPGSVGGFLLYRPGFFSQLPGNGCKQNGQFATPRSWAAIGRVMLTSPDKSPTGPMLSLFQGLVGEGVAAEFSMFLKLSATLPDPQAVLDNPEKALPKPPTEPDKLAALVSGLGEFAAKSKHKDMPLKLLKALAYCSGTTREAACAGIAVFQANKGSVTALVDAATNNLKDAKTADPRIRALIIHLTQSAT